MSKVSRLQPLSKYQWGANCEAWNFVEEAALSVKLERMPAGAAEMLHYHADAQQFFFILHGTATFEIDGEIIIATEKEGVHIPAGMKHRIINHSGGEIEFLLSSQPSTTGDRHMIPEQTAKKNRFNK